MRAAHGELPDDAAAELNSTRHTGSSGSIPCQFAARHVVALARSSRVLS
jgi:hypothetical protein